MMPLEKSSLIASDMASIYDRQPYQILKTLAGGDLPWEDGSGKLSIVLETLSGASVSFSMMRELQQSISTLRWQHPMSPVK